MVHLTATGMLLFTKGLLILGSLLIPLVSFGQSVAGSITLSVANDVFLENGACVPQNDTEQQRNQLFEAPFIELVPTTLNN